MLSHYCPPTVVFNCPACLKIALGNHPLCMGRRWFQIGFICDDPKSREAEQTRPLHFRGRHGTGGSCVTRYIVVVPVQAALETAFDVGRRFEFVVFKGYTTSSVGWPRLLRARYICSLPRMGTFQSISPPMNNVGAVMLFTR